MAKFISHDGTDKNGIRAEVTVMTGTGTISEIIGRGKENEDGSYRNVEVVFDPDNPLLKRKVYGLLDTTSTELWEYVKQAHESGKNVSYRIESQRRNGVDRATPISDLTPTEDVRRILAAIDTHFSHEAKTNPAEDPDNENPSALTQNLTPTGPNAPMDTTAITAAITAAIAGAVPANPAPSHPLYDTTGRLNYGSDAVARAAAAEQFAVNHLIAVYTPAKSKATPPVTDEVLAQAAALAGHLLRIAEEAHNITTGATGATLTPADSRALAVNLTIDAVDKRHPAPLGTDVTAQQEWAAIVTAEVAERMHAIGLLAQGVNPASDTTPTSATAAPEPAPGTTAAPAARVADTATPQAFPGVTNIHEDDPSFTAPDDALVARVRDLCATAAVLDYPREISDWMESVLGSRTARKIHAPVLAEFCDYYENAGPDTVRTEVLAHVA